MTGFYVPIIRNKKTTGRVFERIGGLNKYTDKSHQNSLIPLVEVTSERDLEELHPYRGAGEDLFIELPIYHFTVEDENDLADPVESLSQEFGGQVGFYKANLDDIDTPVVSGSIERPFDYSALLRKYEELSRVVDKCAVRIFISSRRLTEDQETTLTKLADKLSPSEVVLLDIVEIGIKGAVKANLEDLSQIFANTNVIVLNAFNAPQGEPENRGPELSKELGVEGFGDFAIGRRFKNSFPYTGPRKIRLYDPSSSRVVESTGDDYPEAAERLVEDGYLDSDHCEFCHDGVHYDKDGTIPWSRIETGHYVLSALNEDI